MNRCFFLLLVVVICAVTISADDIAPNPSSLRGRSLQNNVWGPDQLINKDTGECVDIFLSMSADTSPAISLDCEGAPRERFYFIQTSEDTYKIKGKRSLKCIGPFMDSKDKGSPIVLMSCDRVETEWKYDKGRLRNVQSQLCLRKGQSLFSVTNILTQGECDEKWFSNSLPDTDNKNKNKNEDFQPETAPTISSPSTISVQNLCLEIPANAPNVGVAVEVGRCDDGPSQRYELLQFNVTNGDDLYQIRNELTGLCLGREPDNPFVLLTTCTYDYETNLFSIVPGTDEKYTIQFSDSSNQCLSLISTRFLFFWTRSYVGQKPCQDASTWDLPGLDLENAKSSSMWAGPFGTPLISVAAANLPDGKIVMWSAAFRDSFVNPNSVDRTYTGIFDPETGLTTEQLIENTAHDMFCPAISTLDDGRILISGGTSDQKVTFFDPSSNTWSPGPDMHITRGYHSSTTLSDSSVFTVGGSWVFGLSTRGNKPGELWNPITNSWTVLDGIQSEPLSTTDFLGPYRADNHMWLFLAPNGLIFHAGPSIQMHWINPKNNTFWPSIRRGDDLDSMKGNVVMYDVGKLLKLGGSENYDETVANNRAYVIDINGDPSNVSIRRVGNMNHKRGFVNSVVLPTGEVVVVGGLEFVRVFSDRTAVLDAEIWNPDTGEFTLLPEPMKVPRTYHSTALLLKDGRVYVAGGGLCSNCRENHPDVEILTPPYLVNNPVRPVIVSGPSQFLPGDEIQVTMDTDVPHTFAIVRFGSVTHSTNTDSRRIPLEILEHSGNTFRLAIPSNPNVALFGHYFLFAMLSSGVPSIALTTFCERPGRRRRAAFDSVASCNYDESCTGEHCCRIPVDADICNFGGCFLWNLHTNRKVAVLDVDEIGRHDFDGVTDYSVRCNADADHVVFSYNVEYHDILHGDGRSWWMNGIHNATGTIQPVDYLGSHCGPKELQVVGYKGHLPCFVRQFYLEFECTG